MPDPHLNGTLAHAPEPTPLQIDYHIIVCLCAISWFPAARSLAESIGPELFPPGASRHIAAAIVSGKPWVPPRHAPHNFMQEAAAIISQMETCSLPSPDDTTYAMYVIGYLAERRTAPLLRAQLLWAAREVRTGYMPFKFIRERVGAAFDIAQGIEAIP